MDIEDNFDLGIDNFNFNLIDFEVSEGGPKARQQASEKYAERVKQFLDEIKIYDEELRNNKRLCQFPFLRLKTIW
jgi:hypothetical protein